LKEKGAIRNQYVGLHTQGTGGFVAVLPTVIAAVVPLLMFVKWTPRVQGIPRGLASGCLGSVTAAMIAHWLTARPQRGSLPDDSINRGRSCRNYLLAGFILTAAIALAISIGVIPSVVADTTHGSYAHTNGVFLGITVAFDLLAVALLASAVWHSRAHDRSSKGTMVNQSRGSIVPGVRRRSISMYSLITLSATQRQGEEQFFR
jgi:uncharacterized membrane protein YhaH (DUF805 family)